MFDIGFTELLMIGVVALIVVGPERLPTLVRTVGLWVGRMRRSLSSIKEEIAEELRVEELRQQAKEKQQQMAQAMEDVQRPFADAVKDKDSDASDGYDEAEIDAHSINPKQDASVTTSESTVADQAAPDSATPSANADKS